MVDDPQEIVLEHLRSIRTTVDQINGRLDDLQQGQINIRKQLNAMQADAIRQEQIAAALQVQVDRINTRLDITDA